MTADEPAGARHLALVGQTASGKSGLAMELAQQLGDVEIVSVDSMQVYRGMDIGTAKPSAAEQTAVRHHLLDLAEPSEHFSLARYRAAAAEALAAIEKRGNRALLVGGTGLYLQAVVDKFQVPGQWPEVRAALDADPDTAALHQRLAGLDPRAASRTEPGNRRRVVRALEVTLGSGQPFSSFGPGVGAFPSTAFDLVGVALPTPQLWLRIGDRLAAQMESGFLEEVRHLAAGEAGMGRTARQALGYRELLAHLEDGVALESAMEEARRRTRAFARRQRAWFRRDPRITWLHADDDARTLLPGLARRWAWEADGTTTDRRASSGCWPAAQ